MVEKGVVKALQDLGLTEYEARVYTALAKIKTGIASEIHLISGIPRSAVYGALAKLEKRGIVEVQHSKPMRYKVVSPSDALDKLLGTFLLGSREAFVTLEELYGAEDVEEEEDEFIWMSRGAKNTHDKILELINAAGKEIYIVAYPVLRALEDRYRAYRDLKPALHDALKRGVEVRIVCASEDEASLIAEEIPGAEVRLYPWKVPQSGILLADGLSSQIIVCSGSDLSKVSAICTEGINIVSMFQDLAEALWQLPPDRRPSEENSTVHK